MLNTNKPQFTNQYARRVLKDRSVLLVNSAAGRQQKLAALLYPVIFILGSQLHKHTVRLFLNYYFPMVFKENTSVIYSAPEPEKYFLSETAENPSL